MEYPTSNVRVIPASSPLHGTGAAMRVYEGAALLGMTSREALIALRSMGCNYMSASSKVSASDWQALAQTIR